MVYYSVLLNTQAVDTPSYMNYHANLLLGQTDGRRTPVYPYFIKLIDLFGGQDLIGHVVIAQCVISFLGIILFYKIAQTAFKMRAVVIAATLLWGVLLPVINFDKLVLTESLSVTFSLLVIYMLIGYLQKPGHFKAWLFTLFVFVAIMLRPSFVYLLPLVVIFWGLRWVIFKKDRKACLSGLAAAVVVILLLMGYSGLNKRNVGFNGISLVSNNNEMVTVFKSGIYLYGDDPAITAAIASNSKLPIGVAGINIKALYGPERIHRFIVNCIKNQPGMYARYMGQKLLQLSGDNLFTNYALHKQNLLTYRVEAIEYAVFFVPFGVLWLFAGLSAGLLVAGWIKRKQAPWLALVLWLLMAGQIAVAIICGYSEYQRLILPGMPAIVILLFLLIDRLYFAINRRYLNHK